MVMRVFLSGNTVILLRLLRFAVHSVLATKYYQASKTPGGVKQRDASKATASMSA